MTNPRQIAKLISEDPDVFEPREFASTQIDLPELKSALDRWVQDNIKPEWLDPTEGAETDPHVTVFFGLKDDNYEPIRSIVDKFGQPVVLSIEKLDYFDAPEYDVLYASIQSDDLHRLNNMLKKLPNGNQHPKYSPHMTIAYLKKGKAEQFKGLQPFAGNFTKDALILYKKDRTKKRMLLRKV